MERRAWWATVHRVPKGRTGLQRLSMHARTSSKPPGRASPYRTSSAATGLSPTSSKPPGRASPYRISSAATSLSPTSSKPPGRASPYCISSAVAGLSPTSSKPPAAPLPTAPHLQPQVCPLGLWVAFCFVDVFICATFWVFIFLFQTYFT